MFTFLFFYFFYFLKDGKFNFFIFSITMLDSVQSNLRSWSHYKPVRNNILAAEPLRRAARRIGRRTREIIPPATQANFKVWLPINCKLISGYSETVHISMPFSQCYPDGNETH